jgi:hypothetical protein
MYERRRQAASLVSLLVVTSLFVWACSSSDHEEATVTTSGGAGSRGIAGGAAPFEAEAGSRLGAGGTIDAQPSATSGGGTKTSMTNGGASPSEHQPSAAGASEAGSGNAGTNGGGGTNGGAGGATEEFPRELGGCGGMTERETGEGGSGTPTSGAPAVGGGPAVIDEPVCDPAVDPSTPDMFLPCTVSSALYVCRHCHGKPPLTSVGTSYVTFADIKRNSALIYGVIKGGTMPWPPYTLSTWQKSTVLKWLGKNGSCAIGAPQGCQ